MAWPSITVHALTLCLETSVRRLSHYVELMKAGLKTVAHWARTDSAFDSMSGDQEFQQLIAELQ